MKLNNNYKKKIGNLGEDFACEFLKTNGFEIVGRNIVVWGGEIDIMALKNKVLHIVEVKTGKGLINPLEHLNLKKLFNLKRAGEYIIRVRLRIELSYVISAISVKLNPDETLKNIEFLENIEI